MSILVGIMGVTPEVRSIPLVPSPLPPPAISHRYLALKRPT